MAVFTKVKRPPKRTGPISHLCPACRCGYVHYDKDGFGACDYCGWEPPRR